MGSTTPPDDSLADAKIGVWFWGLVTLGVGILFVCQILREAYEWARYGEAARLTIEMFVPKPRLDWVGVQSVVDWLWAAQLWTSGFCIMLVSGFFWNNYSEQVEGLKRSQHVRNGAMK